MSEPQRPTEETAAEARPAAGRTRRGVLVLLPLVVFAALAGIFFYQITAGGDPNEVPSVLIGQSAPETRLPPLDGATGAGGEPLPGLAIAGPDRSGGKPLLVNVFASWCAPCRQEHPLLMQLAEDDRLRLVGINYKDEPGNARDFLARLGNPYDAVGVDPQGQSTIDWGVYGVPESFLVAPDGEIVFKQTGPFTRQSVREDLVPALEAIEAGTAADASTS